MKAVTIRGIDDELDRALRRHADVTGASLNATVLSLLRRSLGLAKRKFRPCHRDLDELAGTWTEKDRKAFDGAVSAFSRIDEEMWR